LLDAPSANRLSRPASAAQPAFPNISPASPAQKANLDKATWTGRLLWCAAMAASCGGRARRYQGSIVGGCAPSCGVVQNARPSKTALRYAFPHYGKTRVSDCDITSICRIACGRSVDNFSLPSSCSVGLRLYLLLAQGAPLARAASGVAISWFQLARAAGLKMDAAQTNCTIFQINSRLPSRRPDGAA
jgi:hypothetical protein